MRILLSDAAGLTSRQCARLLGAHGHEVGVLATGRVSLARGTRHVRTAHLVPRFGRDPLAWSDAVLQLLAEHRYDLLVPTQEQVTVLSLRAAEFAERGVAMAVPSFAAVGRVQDKLAAHVTLVELDIPHPPATIVGSAEQLRACRTPVYVKAPIGTASTGVHLAADPEALNRLAARFAELDPAGLGGVLAQEPVDGPLVMVQSVFDNGRLVAAHVNSRDGVGPGNGATHKTSEPVADLVPLLERLGRGLTWHGALSLDVIRSADGPVVIDINPRLVEPGNAAAAGVDLLDAYLAVARGEQPVRCAPGQPGVRTHQLMLALLATPDRRALLRELSAVLRKRRPYRDSTEELTPVHGDARAALFLTLAAAALLVRPRLREWLVGGAVAGYALDAPGWRSLLDAGSVRHG